MQSAMKVFLKRGTKEENDSYTGALGEVTLDTTFNTLRIHDGWTPGGVTTVTEDNFAEFFSAQSTQGIYDPAAVAITGGNIDGQNVLHTINGQYGWRDSTSEIKIAGNGRDNPTWMNFRNGIHAYEFQSGRQNEFWCQFHMGHDYALGTKVYPYVQWSVNTAASGSVRWGMEFTVAKGHNQATGSMFGPTSIVYVDMPVAANSQYRHFLSEVNEISAISADQLEPDALVLVRFFRDGGNDTFSGPVFGFRAGLHYQAARFSTMNRKPNFYG